MKTQEEILKHIEEIKPNDIFGFQTGDFVEFLEFENAKPFLKEGVTTEEWKPRENTPESIKKVISEYLEFAWDKANNCRGLSAGRSIEHMEAWLWLLGDEELTKKFNDTEYEHYGKEKLIVVSEAVGFDWKAHDNGIRTNTDS